MGLRATRPRTPSTTVLDAVETAAREFGLSGRVVLVAASGGIDSTVLTHALLALRELLGIDLCVGHVNHGLRGAGSDADQAQVEAMARMSDVPVRAVRVDPEALRAHGGSRGRPTLQEAARRVRYQALDEMAVAFGADRIATAHTLDDQAETIVFRLLRGAGPDGLGGIPERSPDGRIVRPLLWVGRTEIERFARERGLSWREDPSNQDLRFARGRLRRGGLADLAVSINPDWLRAIGRLAEAQRRDAEWIDTMVREAAAAVTREEDDGLWIRGEAFRALPEPLARRVARHVLRTHGAARDVTRTHLERMLVLLREGRPGSRIELPGGLVLWCEREGGRLRHAAGHPGVAC